MKQKLSANDLKILAVIAMTIDHIAYLFVDRYSLLYYFMRLFGRLTAPIMTFLLVEGYRHTHSRKKYLARLCVFAGISQPVYIWFVYGEFPKNAMQFFLQWNVLFTLTLSLLTIVLMDSQKMQSTSGMILLGILISLAYFGDWSYLIPAWAIIFFCCYKRDTKKMIAFFSLACVSLQTMIYLKQFDSFALFSFQLGTLFFVDSDADV